MTVQMGVVDHKIDDIHTRPRMSICCSSASVMTETLKGQDIDHATKNYQ